MTSLRRKAALGVAAAAAAIVLALTGCTAGDSSGSGSSATPLPDSQQNLTYVPNYAVPSVDPTKAPLEMGTNQVLTNVMQALVKLDSKSVPQPQLATSWKWTDPTTLVFQLRKGVTFSDGQEFTSADVKGSLERYIAQKQALAASLAIITSTSADTPDTFTIHTSAPTGTLVGILSLVYIGEGSHATDDAWWSKPLGTGPFVLTDYVPNDHVTLTRNNDYWGKKAKLKTVTFKLITDTNAKITALSNGQAQVLDDVTNDQIPTIKSMSNVKLTQAPSLTYYFLWFENQHSPLTDVRVRTAMWEALDLSTIVKTLYGSTASTMDSFCPSAAFGCVAASGMPKHNIADAKKLLADAGYPNGFTVDIIYSTANSGLDNLTKAMISAWKSIGITVTPRAEDGASWLADFSALKWDMDVQPNQTVTGDADYTLNRLYSCAAKRLGYCNPDLDKILTQAQQSTDAAQRKTLYKQAVDIMAKDAPAIPLFQTKSNLAYLDTVKGVKIPPTEFIDWSSAYLTK
ncbi:ABC transporter substrate-binding protein [Rathayibacter sp. CAU 1779]